MNPYSYQSSDNQFNLYLRETSQDWLRYSVDFTSAYPASYEENKTVRGEYFQPRGKDSFPLAILIHGWGDRSVIPCKLLARSLAKKGIACFILYLVFHSCRMPESEKKRLPVLSPEEWFEGYRISVIDIRQIIDWASCRTEINSEQISVVRISLGGFVSAIAMGVDKRIKAGVFLTAGGDSEKITWMGRSPVIRKGCVCTREECRRIHSLYPKYLIEVTEKGLENVTPLKQCFLTDAMTFTPYLRNRPILMLNALWDEAIPKQATIDFWKACDKPDIMWFPTTHATIWLWYPIISRKIADFVSSAFSFQDGQAVDKKVKYEI